MFKRGGSSFQSQGTGITSPYDTPRKRYNIGTTYEDIYSQIRETTQDPRGDFSYAAQGFSELANPYKESGEAKTIGEMLYAGAAGVRGSKEKASELEKTGELSILESQGGRLAAEEAHKRKLEEIDRAGKYKASEEWLKKEPRDRQISREKDILIKTAQLQPGGFVDTYKNRIAIGIVDARLATDSADVIPTNLFEEVKPGEYGFDESRLTVDRVWWDPTRGLWIVFEDTTGDGKANSIAYESVNVEDAIKERKIRAKEISTRIETDGTNTQTQDANKIVNVDENGQPIVEKETTSYEEFMQGGKELEEKLTSAETYKGDIYSGDTRGWGNRKKIAQKATGGRIGYEEGTPDPEINELDMLTNWWKENLSGWNKNEG